MPEPGKTWSIEFQKTPLCLSDLRRGVIWAFGRVRWLNARMRIADRVQLT
jgi:hypothetical protein